MNGSRQSRGSARCRAYFVAMLAGLAVLTGCGRPESADSERAIRLSQRNEPTDLDPATASLPDEFFIIRALGEGLLVPNPDGAAPLPGAAERYSVSEDRLTYTFFLREDIKWSNGERLTAHDFVASYRRVLTPETGAPKAHLFYAVRNARAFVRGELTRFEDVGIRANDDTTLVITLERPHDAFPRYVASGAWIPVNPRVVAAHGTRWTQPANHVGNGPFTLTEWKPQQRIIVRRNPGYRDASRVQVDALHFVRFDSADTEDRAFRAGQVDVTMSVPASKLALYAEERPAELHRAPLAETRFISLNTGRAPLNDARVRRALSLSIDRSKIVERVLRGGQTAAGRFLSPALLRQRGPARDETVSVVRHDPALARELLAQAGFPRGVGFPKLEFTGWDRNPTLEAVQQMWKQELGIDVGIVIHEAKVHLASLHAGTYDIAFVTNLLDVPDPVAALADFTAEAPNNFPHWNSPEFERLLREAAEHSHATQREAALLEAERLLLESAAVVPVYFNAQNWLMSPRVRGWQQDALWGRRYDELRLAR